MHLLFLFLPLFGVACQSSGGSSSDKAGTPADSGDGRVDGDGDGSPVGEDCDDADASRAPGMVESCDGVDNDCDDLVDDGLLTTFFADGDGDGYGVDASGVEGCVAPEGFVALAGDCADDDSAVHPDAAELCNGADDDCDGSVDEDGASVWYADADGDGTGDAASATEGCAQPAGSVADGSDCDDGNAAVHPDATERCNGYDDDCDGVVDPPGSDGSDIWHADADGDGFGDASSTTVACDAPEGFVADDADCDDADGGTYPGVPEYCNDKDDDCDGNIDPDSSVDGTVWYADSDGDGYGDAGSTYVSCASPLGYMGDASDCDDTRSTVHPGAIETCNDTDDDCDGVTDPNTSSGAPLWYDDADGDGFGDAAAPSSACDAPVGTVADATDCNDTDADIAPGADEYCNAIDDDCDGVMDPDTSIDADDWYADVDNDGYGDPTNVTAACSLPVGYLADDNDCDDTTGLINPSAAESCNGGDDDCDGVVDPDTSIDASTWYVDADSDGFGFDPSTTLSCTLPAGYAAVGGDCNDRAATINPSVSEVCDAVDNDCDGSTDESSATDASTWYRDADADGYGSAATTVRACTTAPVGYVADATDCADSSALAYPGSHNTELPGDSIDTDCDGLDECTDPTCDGWPDLIIAAQYDGDYITDSYLYTGNGSTFSSTSRTTLATYGAYDTDVTDLDNDGYPDILLTNYYNGTTRNINSYIYWGSSAGFSASDRTSLPTAGATSAVVDDFDNDGYTDIAFANHHNDTTYAGNSYVYWGSAAGYSTSDRTSLPTLGAYRVMTADFDEDGYGDLLYCNFYSGTSYTTNSYLYWGSAAGFSSTDRSDLGTIGAYDAETGDVNGDGWLDIVFADYTDGTNYAINSYVYYGSAAGFSSAYRTALPTAGTLGAAVADLDADGYDDVVYGGYYGGAWTTTANTVIYWGSSLGLSASVYDSIATARGVRDPVVGDLDSDGWPDLVLPRQYDGTSYSVNSFVYWGSAAGYTASDRTLLPTLGVVAASVGDLDSDGYPEIAFSDYYNGSTYTVNSYVYWGSAAGYSTTDRTGVTGNGALAPINMAGATDW